jgi:hypothetical protein
LISPPDLTNIVHRRCSVSFSYQLRDTTDELRDDYWAQCAVGFVLANGILWGIFGLGYDGLSAQDPRWIVLVMLSIVVTGSPITHSAYLPAQIAFIIPATALPAAMRWVRPSSCLGEGMAYRPHHTFFRQGY